MSFEDFWNLQPWTTRYITRALNEERAHFERLAVTAGWFSAVIERQKTVKPLSHFLKSDADTGPRAPQSQDEIRSNMRAWFNAPVPLRPDKEFGNAGE